MNDLRRIRQRDCLPSYVRCTLEPVVGDTIFLTGERPEVAGWRQLTFTREQPVSAELPNFGIDAHCRYTAVPLKCSLRSSTDLWHRLELLCPELERPGASEHRLCDRPAPTTRIFEEEQEIGRRRPQSRRFALWPVHGRGTQMSSPAARDERKAPCGGAAGDGARRHGSTTSSQVPASNGLTRMR